MQINLKQNEIENALKRYVSHQGINLAGKDISISFTAGRKESGISAEITIDDVDIPGYSESAEEVATAPVIRLQSTSVVEVEEAEEPVVETVVEAADATTETKKTSLFG
jgi:hypothetical protein